jgi:hypothetical protein
VTSRLVAVAAVAGLALGAVARAEDASPAARRLRLALEPLRAAGVEKGYAETVEQRVCAALAEHAREAEVVCPADLAAATLLAKNAMVFGECAPDECVKRVEALRAADARVTGALERKDGAVVLTLRLARTGGATAEAAGKLPEDPGGVAERVPGIVKKLLP